jgi:hypothetical protein
MYTYNMEYINMDGVYKLQSIRIYHKVSIKEKRIYLIRIQGMDDMNLFMYNVQRIRCGTDYPSMDATSYACRWWIQSSQADKEALRLMLRMEVNYAKTYNDEGSPS